MYSDSKVQTVNLFNWRGINPFAGVNLRTTIYSTLPSPDLYTKPVLFLWGWFDIYTVNLGATGALDCELPKWFWSQYRGSAPVVNIDNSTPEGILHLGMGGDFDLNIYYAIPKGTIVTPSGDVTYQLAFPDKYGCLCPTGQTETTYQGSVFTSATPGIAYKGCVSFENAADVFIENFDPRERYSYHRVRFENRCIAQYTGLFRSIAMMSNFNLFDGQSLYGASFTGELVAIPGEGQFTEQVTVFNS